MEVSGLAIGIAGLAGLFSACIEAIERFGSYRDADFESRNVIAHFEADKHLFQRWAHSVGLDRANLEEKHADELDDPTTLSTVKDVLRSVHELFERNDTIIDGLHTETRAQKDSSRKRSLLTRTQEPWRSHGITKSQKLRWALSRKEVLVTQVQEFDYLVQKLHQLVPSSTQASNIALFSDSQRMLTQIIQNIREDKRQRISNWLAPPTQSNLYDNSVQTRIDGTCEWFLHRQVFVDWMSEDFEFKKSRFLWVNALAGFGKTILCARIIEEVSSRLTFPCAYHFFSSDSKDDRDPFTAIRAWISQLLLYDENIFDLIGGRFQARLGEQATQSELTEILDSVIRLIPQCTLIVDGLDECQSDVINSENNRRASRGEFMALIKRLIANVASVRVLVSSRDEPDIRSSFYDGCEDRENKKCTEYRISQDDVKFDTLKFANHILEKKIRNKSETFRRDLSERMVDRCCGMFLWLKLQEPDIRGGKSMKQLEQVIDQAPTRLSSLYDRNWLTICQLPEWDRERAFSILRWATFATRPLNILELTEALLVSNDGTANGISLDDFPDEIDQEYVSSEITGLCQSLVEVRKDTAASFHGSMTVHLTHFSVKQYIISNLSRSGLLVANERLRRSSETFESNILAQICLAYLNYSSTWTESTAPISKITISSNQFRNYAAESWYRHVGYDISNGQETLSKTNHFLIPENTSFVAWKRWFDSTKRPFDAATSKIENIKPICYASFLGLRDTVQCLVESGLLHADYELALQAACGQGHFSIVEILLEKYPTYHLEDAAMHASLKGAVAGGHVGIAKKLLELNVGSLKIGDNEQGLVPIAAKGGHLSVVRLLLEHGANIDSVDKAGATALQISVRRNSIELVQLLLEGGANLKLSRGWNSTPIGLAASANHLKVLEFLLEKARELPEEDRVSLMTYDGLPFSHQRVTPVHLAACNGHRQAVTMLHRFIQDNLKNLSIDVTNDFGKTALHDAAERGLLEMVKLLLSQGANPNLKDIRGGTPLHWACRNNYSEIAKRLLTYDTNINTQDHDGRTPLFLTCGYNHLDTIKLLLKNNADPNIPSNDGRVALFLACEERRWKTVQLLLESGAEVDTTEKSERWTPLYLASSEGNLKIVKSLLEKGASVNALVSTGVTALDGAASKGQKEVVKLLLDHGASVNLVNGKLGTTLTWAAAKGQREIVKMLLDYGADVNLIGAKRRTALTVAIIEGHEEVVRLLLDYGADVNLPACGDGTVLVTAAKSQSTRNESIMILLLESRAIAKRTLNTLGSYGRTPLHWIAEMGWSLKVVNALLARGNDPNSLDHFHQPPLHYAAEKGHLEIVKRLVDITNLSVLDVHGRSALKCAQIFNHTEVVELLSSYEGWP